MHVSISSSPYFGVGSAIVATPYVRRLELLLLPTARLLVPQRRLLLGSLPLDVPIMQIPNKHRQNQRRGRKARVDIVARDDERLLVRREREDGHPCGKDVRESVHHRADVRALLRVVSTRLVDKGPAHTGRDIHCCGEIVQHPTLGTVRGVNRRSRQGGGEDDAHSGCKGHDGPAG